MAIPHYCYHPKLSIAGNCRMCMVEIEKMPKLQIACNTQVAEGMSVLTQSPKVLAVRKAVLEFLLINHPVDCPICDQAGECQLQNYYMEHNREASRFEVGKGPRPQENHLRSQRYFRRRALHQVHALRALLPGDHQDRRAGGGQPRRSLDDRAVRRRRARQSACRPTSSTSVRSARSPTAIFVSKCGSGIWTRRRRSAPAAAPAATSASRPIRIRSRASSRASTKRSTATGSATKGATVFTILTGGERLTTPMIRQEGGLVPTTWEQALQAVLHRACARRNRWRRFFPGETPTKKPFCSPS